MNPVRTLRWLAWGNLVCGVILGLFALLIISGAVLGSLSGPHYFDALTIVNGIGFLAYFLILLLPASKVVYDTTRHLKRPELKSALNISLNSSVIFWVLIAGPLKYLLPHDRLKIKHGPFDPVDFALEGLGVFTPMIIAWLVYRLLLKPTALRAFPPQNQRNASSRVA